MSNTELVHVPRVAPQTTNGTSASESSPPATRSTRKRRAAVKHLTTDELNRFFSVIESPRDTAIFRIAYHRGLRAGEIGRLQFSDVHLRDDRIEFERLKGSNGGLYHLCSSEVRALRAWLRVRGRDPGPLFPSRRGKGIVLVRMVILTNAYFRDFFWQKERVDDGSAGHAAGGPRRRLRRMFSYTLDSIKKGMAAPPGHTMTHLKKRQV